MMPMPLPYWIFAVTLFLSSFLLFQIQPLIGKHIVPWLGGGSTIWITAMLFFMLALSAGYFYALWLTRLPDRWQKSIHLVLITLVVATLSAHSALWPSAITPAGADAGIDLAHPVWTVFTLLGLSVGLPFFLLSSTSTLFQWWYARLSGREPFSLYAVSNAGSFCGLLSYPFLFEPYFSTIEQGYWWTAGLAVYCVLLIVIIHRTLGTQMNVTVAPAVIRLPQLLRWIGLTSIPVITMLFGTHQLTTSIATVPFLWIAPLTLYLLSFVISFRDHTPSPGHTEARWAIVGSVSGLASILFVSQLPIILNILILLLTMFSIFHWCHETLYRTRPVAAGLTVFYVALSLGGVLGSIVVLGVTLVLLVYPIEFVILLVLVGLVALTHVSVPQAHLKPTLLYHFFRGNSFQIGGKMALAVLLVTLGTSYVLLNISSSLFQTRNFFGPKYVADMQYNQMTIRTLIQGLTNHGGQIISDPAARELPVTYYGPNSGVGKVFAFQQTRSPKKALRVAILGVGGGGLAAYCRPTDEFTFFEIDPQVVEIAYQYFDYLERCPRSSVSVIDGRLGLEERLRDPTHQKYDMIIIDAYADDLMPVHLLTAEAIAVYRSLLAPEGVLLTHISSRYLNMDRVIAAYDGDGWHGRLYEDATAVFPYQRSLWGVFSRTEDLFAHAPLDTGTKLPDQPVFWTDTSSALLPILR